jgi:uncharacterized protein YlzI (FlbEa/FlbD family)
MIKLTGIDGQRHYVAVQNVARITEAGTSSQWHGIKSYVKLYDGTTLECRESADQVHDHVQATVNKEHP